MVWGVDDGNIIRSICCNSKNCGNVLDRGNEEGIEQLVPRTLFHSMLVDDPDPTRPSFIYWIRMGVDPMFVFMPAPVFSDPVISLT